MKMFFCKMAPSDPNIFKWGFGNFRCNKDSSAITLCGDHETFKHRPVFFCESIRTQGCATLASKPWASGHGPATERSSGAGQDGPVFFN